MAACDFYSFGGFAESTAVLIGTSIFMYLTWAAGYIQMLKNAAYRAHWGLTWISERRWPRRKGTSFQDIFT